MAYRFDIDAPLGKDARRILIEQIERAEKRLKSTEDRAVAVHEARKHFKRIRALLRLLRPVIGKEAFRAENADFRQTAGLLAGSRDSFVLGETLSKLEAEHGLDPAKDTSPLRAALSRATQSETSAAGSPAVKEALRRLRAAKARIGKLKIDIEDASRLTAGLERCYAEALQAREDALASGSIEDFHDWRKRVQQHWRHMGLLTKVWPDLVNARIRVAKRLSATLGDDHDLANLIAFIARQPAEVIDEAAARRLIRLARKSQTRLRSSAAIDAEILFADGPKGLARRIETYWMAARARTSAKSTACSTHVPPSASVDATGAGKDVESTKVGDH